MLYRLFYVAYGNIVLIVFGIHRYQHYRSLQGKTEINYSYPAALAFTRQRPTDFASTFSAGYDIASKGVVSNPANKGVFGTTERKFMLRQS
jgi:hypothetical protein